MGSNSDSLYLAGLYRDIFVDRVGLDGWAPQPATSLFPDAPVFFALRAMLGHAGLAVGAYAGLMVVAIALLVSDLARLAAVPRGTRWLVAGAAACTIGLAGLADSSFGNAIYPAHHGASLVVGLAVLALVARQARSREPRFGVLACVALLGGGTAAFDPIYLVWCAAPMAAAVAAGAALRVVDSKPCAWLLAAIGIGAAASTLGAPLERALGMRAPPIGTKVDLSWRALGHAARVLREWEWQPTLVSFVFASAIVTMVGASVVCGLAIRSRFADGHDRARSSGPAIVRFLLAAVLWLSVVGTLLGVACSGMLGDRFTVRYLQPVYVLPCVALPLTVALVRARRSRGLVAGVTVLLALALRTQASARPALARESLSLHPPPIACVDDVARQGGARFGYGDYWSARKTTELSRVELRVLPLTWDAADNPWIANAHWRAALAAKQTSFVVLTSRLDERALRARFGEPREIANCPGGPVWTYAAR